MTIRVESAYQANQFVSKCVICGRSAGGRFTPPVRHSLLDGDDKIGEVCERCAYGSVDLWRMALTEYAIRLETRAAVIRDLAARVEDGEPAPEGIAEEIVREQANQVNRRPPFPPFRFGD